MAGRAEQRRRESHIKREVDRELSRVYAILEQEGVDLLRGYLQSRLGMTKPLEQIRRELGIKREQAH